MSSVNCQQKQCHILRWKTMKLKTKWMLTLNTYDRKWLQPWFQLHPIAKSYGRWECVSKHHLFIFRKWCQYVPINLIFMNSKFTEFVHFAVLFCSQQHFWTDKSVQTLEQGVCVRVCMCVSKLHKLLICFLCNFCIFNNCSLSFKIYNMYYCVLWCG